ncbi:MFS transporter [Candidatus Bathyarchaeota archaeon]|nr:MFS transporter [Candidatus Bathyarchaeota archaeon]
MRQHPRLKLPDVFDRDMKLLLYSMASRRVVMGFLQVVRAIYFALLGFDPITIGFLLSIAAFVGAVHSITFGLLSDRFGRKAFLLLGGFFATMRLVIFALSTDFWLLALGQGVGALGEGVGAGQPVVSGYITDKTNSRKRAPVFGTLAVTNAIATTVGNLMAGLPTYFQESLRLNMVEAHSLLFWFGIVASAASLLLIIPIEEVKLKKGRQREVKRGFLEVKSWDVIGRFSLVRSTSGLGWGLIGSLLPLYFFIRFDVGTETLGPIYAVTRFLSIFSYLLMPRIVERFGDISTIIASRLLTAGLTAAFPMTGSYPLAVALLIVFRTIILFTMPIRQSFATGIVAPEETATVIGISSFSRMTLRSIAPTLAGYMFETLSLSLPFLSGAGLMAVNAILYRAFFQPKNK